MSQYFSAAMTACDNRCVYCGKDMLIDFETFMTGEEDHLIPRSRGGLDDATNIVIACSLCNRLKAGWVPPNGESMDRKELVNAIREEILRRRLKHMQIYFGWVFKNQELRPLWSNEE